MQKEVTQSVGKAAGKTFAQSFVAVLVLLLVPVLGDWSQQVAGGGTIEVDVNFFMQVLIAAIGGGIAALISFAQNALK